MVNVKSKNIHSRAYKFSLDMISLIKEFPKSRVYVIFADQLLRAATSVGANLTEARSSSSRKDFARYYEIALRSCNETSYWLYLLKDGKLVESGKLNSLIGEASEIGKMIASSLLTLRGKKV